MAPRTLIYTVPLLNQAVAGALRGIGLGGRVLVKGEIANVSRRDYDGWPMVFFDLKDGDETLSCISFGNALKLLLRRDTQTGEIFTDRKIEDVLVAERKVLLEGVLGTYTRGRSVYRLMVNSVTDIGEGELMRRFREVRDRLSKLGYFSDDRKRRLPLNPTRIALITSEKGAVIHDFLQNARDRGFGCHIEFYPVRVQGIGAGAEIAEAVQKADARGTAQVIVIIRGGGSADDLACFNEEILAQAIFASKLPVLTGIGHEVDHTLAEMTADVGASTPTKAAQLLWTPRSEILAGVTDLAERAAYAFRGIIDAGDRELGSAGYTLKVLSPASRLRRMRDELARLTSDLARYGERMVSDRAFETARLAGSADDSMRQRLAAETASVLSCAGRLPALGRNVRVRAENGLAMAAAVLKSRGRALVEGRSHDVESLALQLEAVSPLRPLERGFALVRDGKGGIVRGTASLAAGERVRVVMADGSFGALVEDVAPAREKTGKNVSASCEKCDNHSRQDQK